MNTSLICKASLGALGVFALSAKAEAASKKQPNVVFIFADDQPYATLGVTGHPVVKTPNIDGLAKNGALFSQAFMTSPISGPSRSNIFTGQWERKNHIGFTYISKGAVKPEIFENSFLMQLKKVGYSTAFIGKHHTTIVNSQEKPLRENIDFCYFGKGHLGFYPAKSDKTFSNLKNKSQLEGLYESFEAYMKPGNEYDYFYENADPSIKNQIKRRDADKPFVAWINFNLPHAASIGGMGSDPADPKFYTNLYNDQLDQIPLPENYPVPITLPTNVYGEADLMNYYKTSNKSKLLSEKVRMLRAIYSIDLFVGKVQQLLKDLGEDENTIIVYASDHGLFHGEHGLGGKTLLYDESVRFPLIVYSPYFSKKQQGRTYDQFVVGQDIPATILDMCGVAVPDTYHGKSMLPILEGKNVALRDYVFTENLFPDQGYPRMESVIGEDYKYIRYFSKENDRKKYLPMQSIEQNEAPIYEELFDRAADPKEQNNLAADKKYKKILDEYRKRCKELVVYYSK